MPGGAGVLAMMSRSASTDSSDNASPWLPDEEHLDVGGLPVGALRARGGERVAPEVLHVLDVLGVLVESLDQLVVVAVRVGAQRLVALEHHHRGTVGVELAEHLADALKRLQRGRIGELNATLCSSPTASSCGTSTFVRAATATQNSTIGTQSQRIHLATRSVVVGRSARWLLIRTCPGSRCRRSTC